MNDELHGSASDAQPEPRRTASTDAWRGAALVALQFTLLAVLALRGGMALRSVAPPGDAVVVFVAAAALGLWALWANRPGNFNIRPVPRAGGKLVTHGPYRWIRHPMYTSVLLAGFAAARIAADAPTWMSLAGLAVALLVKALVEERAMLERHLDYRDYQRGTKRFVPWVF